MRIEYIRGLIVAERLLHLELPPFLHQLGKKQWF